jgi:cyclophilin family peptidyl-prolyl cis-trans isomerase
MTPMTDLDGDYTIFGQVQEDSLSNVSQIAPHDPTVELSLDGTTVINSIEIIEN